MWDSQCSMEYSVKYCQWTLLWIWIYVAFLLKKKEKKWVQGGEVRQKIFKRHMYFSNSAEFKICKGTTSIKYTLEKLCVIFLITLFVNGTWSPRAWMWAPVSGSSLFTLCRLNSRNAGLSRSNSFSSKTLKVCVFAATTTRTSQAICLSTDLCTSNLTCHNGRNTSFFHSPLTETNLLPSIKSAHNF